MPGKIILFIASEKGYTAFSAVVMQNYAHKIGAVVTFKETDVAKSWDNDIREECIHSKIPFYFWADIKNNMFAVMQEHDCKYAVTISWKYLLPVEINKYLKYPPSFCSICQKQAGRLLKRCPFRQIWTNLHFSVDFFQVPRYNKFRSLTRVNAWRYSSVG